jgi:hypothetical protein
MAATYSKSAYSSDKLFMLLEIFKSLGDHAYQTLAVPALTYVSQQIKMQEMEDDNWLARLYTRLIRLPLT